MYDERGMTENCRRKTISEHDGNITQNRGSSQSEHKHLPAEEFTEETPRYRQEIITTRNSSHPESLKVCSRTAESEECVRLQTGPILARHSLEPDVSLQG
jgi:hypothetical protein